MRKISTSEIITKPTPKYSARGSNLSSVDASALSVWRDKYNDADISIDQFKYISQLNCFYCGAEPNNGRNAYKNRQEIAQYRRAQEGFIYNGLDRIDNNLAHTIENVVPCCIHCNWAKSNKTIDDYKSDILGILYNRIIHYDSCYSEITTPALTGQINVSFIPKEKAQRIPILLLAKK